LGIPGFRPPPTFSKLGRAAPDDDSVAADLIFSQYVDETKKRD
jgi:hypothetical protein